MKLVTIETFSAAGHGPRGAAKASYEFAPGTNLLVGLGVDDGTTGPDTCVCLGRLHREAVLVGAIGPAYRAYKEWPGFTSEDPSPIAKEVRTTTAEEDSALPAHGVAAITVDGRRRVFDRLGGDHSFTV